MTSGVDYAWGRPSASALQAAGVAFAARYLSHDTSKALDRAEADDLAAHGIWIAVVFEDGAQRPLAGYAAGAADAQFAAVQAAAAGMPPGRPIYFAADFDVTPQQQTAVNAYLAGAASALGAQRVGIYGGYYTVKRALDAGAAAWGWQTVGWSGGQWDPRAALRQPGSTVTIGGVQCDTDTAQAADFGQWQPGRTPTSTPTATAAPATPTGDDMAIAIGSIPPGFAADATGALTDRSKAITIPLPTVADNRWGWQMVDLSFAADFTPSTSEPVTLRVAIHNASSGWRVQTLTLQSAEIRQHVWLEGGDDKASVARMPSSAADTAADIPIGWLVEAK